MLESLKQEVYEANLLLPKYGIVTFTWGNVSGIDRERGIFAIKPSGVPYEELRPEDIVLVDLETGKVVEGELNPSSDTPTHRVLYEEFPTLGAVVHTHSPWAVSFAEAGLPIEAMGTTHADSFYGDVPVTDALTQEVLVRQHGPFTWGPTPKKAVENAKVLDVVAEMNYHALQLTRADCRVPQYLLDKHYFRKHGAHAYYGQAQR